MTPPPVIVRPERLGRQKRFLQRAATLLAWSAYAWLWVPLVTLVAWVVGIHAGWERLYLQRNAVDPFILASLPIIALLCGLLLIGWAEYNRARFRGRERRLPRPLASLNEVAADLGASTGLAERLMGCKAATLHMDDHARPIGIRREVV